MGAYRCTCVRWWMCFGGFGGFVLYGGRFSTDKYCLWVGAFAFTDVHLFTWGVGLAGWLGCFLAQKGCFWMN